MASKSNSGVNRVSVLAFERKLDPSDALMYAGVWPERDNEASWAPITLRTKAIRGTISNRMKTAGQDPAKLDAAIQNPNLQTVDVATLPAEADSLRVRFTLRVLPGLGQASACDQPEYQSKLHTVVRTYIESTGLSELGERYAVNLAMGRFLWRNRAGAEAVHVEVAHMQGGQPSKVWNFDGLAHPLNEPQAVSDDEKQLGEAIAQALGSSQAAALVLRVTATVRMGAGVEVFPSQELILDKPTSKDKKSKTLYHVDGVAAMHSQKIGNALRTIDTWYPAADAMGPIAVEPYGSVTTQGKAYRPPQEKQDFYTLLDGWMLQDKEPTQPQQHFVMAVLIRGGVFGDTKEKGAA